MAEKAWYERDFDEETEDEPTPTVEVTEAPTPSNVGQHTLLSYLIANYDAWTLAEPIIKSTYFDDEYKPVVEYLIEHTREYKEIPSIPIVRMKTGVQLDRYDDAQDDRRTQWLIDEIETFCRHRATELEIRRAGMAIQNDSSRQTLEQIFQNLKLITEISLQKDLGIEVHKDARTMLSTKQEQQTKASGYRWLDRVTGGGLPCPGMLLIPGAPGLGKSNMLTNLLCNYAERGEFAVYISLELSEQRIFERVCSILTDTNIREIYQKKDRVADDLESRIQTPSGGLLYIKKMKMMGTTRSNINAYLKELYMKEGRKPTVLGLDYLDLLFPMTPIRDMANINQKDKYTSMEFYSVLEDWNMLGITPSQRVKNQAELDEFDLAGTAGGAPKNDIADYIMTIKRQDEELMGYVQKGRYGGDGTKLPFLWNVNTLKISDGPEEKFYHLNPRWDPHFDRKNEEKNAIGRRQELNKDIRNARADDIRENIARRNQSLFNPYGIEEPDDLAVPE
jgi:KaiC/GvpD/RAD55 family RecA-like ATPase